MPERIEGPTPLIAVDVGNSRMKWGLFSLGRLVHVAPLPLADTIACDKQLRSWGITSGGANWCVASVNPDGSEPFLAWLRGRDLPSPFVLDDPSLLPVRVDLQPPYTVGIDRLLDVVAVNERRPAGRSAVIVDAGSAITVDAVSSSGDFVGGAIAAGLRLSSHALYEFTYSLPLVNVTAAPAAVGKSTAEAIESGLFWGTVGAVKELIARLASAIGDDPVVYVSGGDGDLLAPHLGRPVERALDLTLHGIYLTYQHARSRRNPSD